MALHLAKRIFHKIDKKAALKWIGIILLIVIISLIATRIIWKETLEQWVIQAGARWPVLLILWKAISVIFVPFTGSITYIIAWGLYGTWKATLFGAIWNAIGMSVAFFIWRKWGIQAVTRIIGEKNRDEVVHLVSHLNDIKTFTLTRIILFPLEDLINYASGMSKISFIPYFIISIIIVTLLSLLPIIFGHFLI